MKKIFKPLTNARALFIFLLVLSFFVGSIFNLNVLADDANPPSFPACETKIFSSNGDWAHYDFGVHGIVGVGNLSGRDDVYSLASKNFLQCFCPIEGTSGIQSNWWDVQKAGLTRDQINSYKTQGWREENGSGWNLYNETYLVKNRDFSCAVPSVTPTPIPGVSVTPAPGPQSKCFDLEAQPSEGSAPLTVKFIAHADDPATGGKIKQYRFDFADTSGGQPQVWFQTDATAYHRYERSGNYEANLRIQDNAGNWRESDDCKVTVKVSSAPHVLGASTTSELPSTGLSSMFAALVLILPGLGFYLYKRFRLI